MKSVEVVVSDLELVRLETKWPELEAVCLINDRLKAQKAPHVAAILSPETWKTRILTMYSSVCVSRDRPGQTRFTFRFKEEA